MRYLEICAILTLFLGTLVHAAAPAGPPPGDPATFEISVAPGAVPAGGTANVSLKLVPAAGIKINKYPKIKLAVAEQAGLVGAAEGVLGTNEAPPADKMDTNYFKTIDPVTLTLQVSGDASAGKHEIPAKLTYYYCVAASGYCAPAKVPVKIAVTVR